MFTLLLVIARLGRETVGI